MVSNSISSNSMGSIFNDNQLYEQELLGRNSMRSNSMVSNSISSNSMGSIFNDNQLYEQELLGRNSMRSNSMVSNSISSNSMGSIFNDNQLYEQELLGRNSMMSNSMVSNSISRNSMGSSFRSSNSVWINSMGEQLLVYYCEINAYQSTGLKRFLHNQYWTYLCVMFQRTSAWIIYYFKITFNQ